MRELYRRRYGNPELDPQTANNYEAGLTWSPMSHVQADFTIYHSDVDDLIERPDRRAPYTNLDRVTFKGFGQVVIKDDIVVFPLFDESAREQNINGFIDNLGHSAYPGDDGRPLHGQRLQYGYSEGLSPY